MDNNRHFEGRLESFQDGRLTLDLSVASHKSRKKMGAAAEQGRRLRLNSPMWRRRIWYRKSREISKIRSDSGIRS